MKKSTFSLLMLVLFAAGMGWEAFRPDLRLFLDTEWDPSGLALRWGRKGLALAAGAVVLAGFAGWTRWIGETFLGSLPSRERTLPAFSAATALFSMTSFALAVHGILRGPLVLFFFAVAASQGLRVLRDTGIPAFLRTRWTWFVAVPLVLWAFEYLSPPVAWDAVLDHFRFARETARTHQLPLRWPDHTGDMPKFADIQWAAFYAMGGETLARLGSVLALLLTLFSVSSLLRHVAGAEGRAAAVIVSCGMFLFVYTHGYAEGFLASYELAALACLAASLSARRGAAPLFLSACFLLGCAFAVKYTALFALAGMAGVLLFSRVPRPRGATLAAGAALLILPVLPWLLRNFLANGNPFYPLMTSWFGAGPGGYNPGMEKALWSDTGAPVSLSPVGVLRTLWANLFTPSNQVGASYTPLVLMSIPWFLPAWRDRAGRVLLLYASGFLACWILFATSLRHAAGGVLALAVFSGLAWSLAFRERARGARVVFAAGWLVAVWLSFTAQLRTDAPYAAALGLESRDARLARHYHFDDDAFAAYRAIEKDMRPGDKVLAFGVFQAYPLKAPALVDFKWKVPRLLQWESEAGTAERLWMRLRREGVRYILVQQEEARRMVLVAPKPAHRLGRVETARFWDGFMEPWRVYRNTIIFRVRDHEAERTGLEGKSRTLMMEKVLNGSGTPQVGDLDPGSLETLIRGSMGDE